MEQCQDIKCLSKCIPLQSHCWER